MRAPITIQVKLNRVDYSLKITVPVEVVRALKLKAGDTLEVGLTDSTMTVKKAAWFVLENHALSSRLSLSWNA